MLGQRRRRHERDEAVLAMEAGAEAPAAPASRCPTCLKQNEPGFPSMVATWFYNLYTCPDAHQWTVIRATGDMRYWPRPSPAPPVVKKGWARPEDYFKNLKTAFE